MTADAASPSAGQVVVAVDEPIGRFSAVHTINRGLQEAPVLRQGLALTWCLAAVGATGRVVVPILLQQAIDKGIADDGGVRVGFVGALVRRSPPSPSSSPPSPSAPRSSASAGAASRRCTTCGPA